MRHTLETPEVALTYSQCRNNFHWVPSAGEPFGASNVSGSWLDVSLQVSMLSMLKVHIISTTNCAWMLQWLNKTKGLLVLVQLCHALFWSLVYMYNAATLSQSQHTSHFEPLPCREALELSPGQGFEKKRLDDNNTLQHETTREIDLI